MARYKYIRSSSKTQNNEYQKSEEGYEMFIDVVSGIVPFEDREKGSELLAIVKAGDTIQVESLDRLGRDALNTLTVLNQLKKKKINVEIKSLGVSSLLENGKSNPAFEIISNVLSIINQQMRENLLEAQKKGIAVAKALNKYKGRKRGSTIPRSLYLERNAPVVKVIKKHPELSLRELSMLSGVSHVKVKKIKEML